MRKICLDPDPGSMNTDPKHCIYGSGSATLSVSSKKILNFILAAEKRLLLSHRQKFEIFVVKIDRESTGTPGVNTPPPSPSLSGESEDSNSMDGPGKDRKSKSSTYLKKKIIRRKIIL